MASWQPAYVGIGSNLDDPAAQVRAAIDRLARIRLTRRVLVSSSYRTAPFGVTDQPEFVNAAAGLLTQLDPASLLTELRAIESAMGRARRERWGPRVIDLDLLVYGTERRTGGELTLPHPGIVERNFVLYPLAEIAPDLEVPGLGRTTELKERVGSAGIRPLEELARPSP
jgi:2-amino-4-hydroxy-6-hydroxymethyldihydropteridine diphosphokinase